MGMKLVDEQIFRDIAAAIKYKINSNDPIQVSQMPNKIRGISSQTITEIISSYSIENIDNKKLLKFNKPNNLNQILSIFIINQNDNSSDNEYVECFYGYSFYNDKDKLVYCSCFCSKNVQTHETYLIDEGAFSISDTKISISAYNSITEGWHASPNTYKIILTYIPN